MAIVPALALSQYRYAALWRVAPSIDHACLRVHMPDCSVVTTLAALFVRIPHRLITREQVLATHSILIAPAHLRSLPTLLAPNARS